MTLHDIATTWTRRHGRGTERATAKDSLARLLKDMLVDIDAGERSPLRLFRSRFPQHALVADALRVLLPWHQRRRFDRVWQPYRFLWQLVHGAGTVVLSTPPGDHAVDRLRRRVNDLLAFLRA